MWHEVDWAEVQREHYERWGCSFDSPERLEAFVVMTYRHRYGAEPCGAVALHRLFRDYYFVTPLPSVSTIQRILTANCLTHGRLGYIPGETPAPYSWRPKRKARW